MAQSRPVSFQFDKINREIEKQMQALGLSVRKVQTQDETAILFIPDDKIEEVKLWFNAIKNPLTPTPNHPNYFSIPYTFLQNMALYSKETLNDQLFLYIDSPDLAAKDLRTLINLGADVNVKNSNGLTALSVAALRGKPEIVDLLLQAGADPKKHDFYSDSPLQIYQFAFTRLQSAEKEYYKLAQTPNPDPRLIEEFTREIMDARSIVNSIQIRIPDLLVSKQTKAQPTSLQQPTRAQPSSKQLFVFDFDHTIADGHMHNTLMDNSFIPQIDTHPHLNQDKQWEFLTRQQTRYPHLMHPIGGAERWQQNIKNIIDSGHEVGVASFGNFPHIIKRYFRDVIKLEEPYLSRVAINSYLPPDQSVDKSKHIDELQRHFNIPDNSKVTLVDDNDHNVRGAISKGYQAIRATNDAAHLSMLESSVARSSKQAIPAQVAPSQQAAPQAPQSQQVAQPQIQPQSSDAHDKKAKQEKQKLFNSFLNNKDLFISALPAHWQKEFEKSSNGSKSLTGSKSKKMAEIFDLIQKIIQSKEFTYDNKSKLIDLIGSAKEASDKKKTTMGRMFFGKPNVSNALEIFQKDLERISRHHFGADKKLDKEPEESASNRFSKQK